MENPEVFDRWGNFRIAPEKTIEEVHGDNFARVFFYETGGKHYFAYQLKFGTFLKQKIANIKDKAFDSFPAARLSALREIETVCTANRNVRKLIADFVQIRYNQPTLFDEDRV
jgi:hypothetical protein